MTTAYGYIRVSGKSQINGDGPERQDTAIKAYAKSHDIRLLHVYFEQGVCGDIETMGRPAFIELMTAIGPDCRTVIVERLDRLSRQLITQETCIQDFSRQGITLLSTEPAEYDLMASDPGRVLVRQVFGAIAQYDKAMLVVKLRVARARMKASTGRCEGQKPYTDTPEGRKAFGRATELRGLGLGFDKIASHLNAEGVPTKRTGTAWHGSTVNKMMTAQH